MATPTRAEILKFHGNSGDARPWDAETLRDDFLGEIDDVGIGMVTRREQPSAEPLSRGMKRMADGELRDAVQACLKVGEVDRHVFVNDWSVWQAILLGLFSAALGGRRLTQPLHVRIRHKLCDPNGRRLTMTGHDEELRLCRLEIARLSEENGILRESSESFGALAERLNDRLRVSGGVKSDTKRPWPGQAPSSNPDP